MDVVNGDGRIAAALSVFLYSLRCSSELGENILIEYSANVPPAPSAS